MDNVMKYCYDEPAKDGNRQVCYTEEKLKEIYDRTYADDMSYSDFVQEWIAVNLGYKVED